MTARPDQDRLAALRWIEALTEEQLAPCIEQLYDVLRDYPPNVTAREAMRRLLRQLVGVSLSAPPAEPSEEAITLALNTYVNSLGRAIEENNGTIPVTGYYEAHRGALRAAYAIDGGRAASRQAAPTDADEPPWDGWFSCADCFGWFYGKPEAYDSGDEVCASCAERRDKKGASDALRAATPQGPWQLAPPNEKLGTFGVEREPQPGVVWYHGAFASEQEALAVRDALNRVAALRFVNGCERIP